MQQLGRVMNRTAWLLVLLFGLAGCRNDRSGPDSSPDEPPVLLHVGHVGHDHQLALYVAALRGEQFRAGYGIYLKQVKPQEVYDLVDGGKALARLRLVRVGGGSRMPAAMSRGEIQIGLGGVAAVAKFADGGQPFKIICPLQTDGDMLVMKADSPIRDWDSFLAAARAGPKALRIGYKAPVAVAKLIFERALLAEEVPASYDPTRPGPGVVLVNMGSEASPIPLLSAGAIDGFVMNQPAVAVAVDRRLGRVIAELRDLPPPGKWVNHPCCCVAATGETLGKHPQIVKALLKVIVLATEQIRQDPQMAIDCASEWTKYSRAVEAASIPTITYLAEPTESWLAGMATWVVVMQDVKAFTGKYKQAAPEEVLRDVLDLRLCRAALAELRRQRLIQRQ